MNKLLLVFIIPISALSQTYPILPASPSSDYKIFLRQLGQTHYDAIVFKARKANVALNTAYSTTEAVRGPKIASIEIVDTKTSFLIEPITTRAEAKIKREDKSLYVTKTLKQPIILGIALKHRSMTYDTEHRNVVFNYSIGW